MPADCYPSVQIDKVPDQSDAPKQHDSDESALDLHSSENLCPVRCDPRNELVERQFSWRVSHALGDRVVRSVVAQVARTTRFVVLKQVRSYRYAPTGPKESR